MPDPDELRRIARQLHPRGARQETVGTAIAAVLTAAADLHPAYWRVPHPTVTDLLDEIERLGRLALEHPPTEEDHDA